VPPHPIDCGRRILHIFLPMKAFSTWPSSSRSTPAKSGWLVSMASQPSAQCELVTTAALEMAIHRRRTLRGGVDSPYRDRGAHYY
jgi:hypothetical protein